jgi:hypothetical protein
MAGESVGGKNVDWMEKVSDEQYRKRHARTRVRLLGQLRN